MPLYKEVSIVRARDGRLAADADKAATEEPLEVRLHGRPFAVIMRTPGADRALAAGFLFSEGVLTSADDLGTIAHCTDVANAPSPATSAENVLNVTLSGNREEDLDRILADRRQVVGNSSCGMCGRLTIESLTLRKAPLEGRTKVSRHVILECADRLRASQATFDETGGIHAAGLFGFDGRLHDSAEDVGRHNAVDKLIGRQLMNDGLPLSDSLLFVSGRTSFEIVQKAFLAGLPVVAAVSAPSSLAIELAEEAGITLLGFVREGGFNIYTHAERIG